MPGISCEIFVWISKCVYTLSINRCEFWARKIGMVSFYNILLRKSVNCNYIIV